MFESSSIGDDIESNEFVWLCDRLQKGKIMLLASLAAWIIFNVPIGFIHPPATSCLVYNQSGFFIQTPKALKQSNRPKRSSFMDDVDDVDFLHAPFNTPNLFNGADGDDGVWAPPKALTLSGELAKDHLRCLKDPRTTVWDPSRMFWDPAGFLNWCSTFWCFNEGNQPTNQPIYYNPMMDPFVLLIALSG